jgi:hypothetical protein
MAQAVPTQYLATFDTDISANNAGDNNGSYAVTKEWNSQDSEGSATSGSMYVSVTWNNSPGGWQEIQIGFDQPGIDATKWLKVELDVKIDRTNSNVGPEGNYGALQPVCQSCDGTHGWVELAATTLNNVDGWQHVVADLSSFPYNLNRLVVRLGGRGGASVTNTIKYWVDSIKLTAAPVSPPTLGNLQPATPPGLVLLPCTSGQYQRVMLYPNPDALGSDFGWHSRATPATPVTYSFTLTDFPTVNDYAANIYLIPNAHMRDGNAGRTDIDWGCTNGLFFNITANTNNPATNWNVDVSVKTNMVSDGSNPNSQILSFDYPQLPVGTWTLRFDNNTDFTIIAPNGFTTNGSLTSDVADLVSGFSAGDSRVTVYFGTMPRTTTHIGVPSVYGRIQVQGVPSPVNDNFSSGVLDTTNLWRKLADYPAGVFVTTSDLKYYLSWNTPNDQGFTSLLVAGAVTGPYKEMGVDSSKWLLVNGTRRALIYKSAVNTALGGSEASAAFFRLIKREYTKLQVLLPGETAAPGTPTGKTGTPIPQPVGASFTITINAVDTDGYLMSNVTGELSFTSSDPIFGGPAFAAILAGGTATADVSFSTAGSQTITATSVADNTKTGTSSAVTVTSP